MPHRPQFAMPGPPPPCGYEAIIYVFDGTNTPALNGIGALNAGDELQNVPLKLNADEEFIWLGVKLAGVSGSVLAVKFQTPWTDPLMDDYTPVDLYAGNVVPTPLEAGVYCPTGSALTVSIKNLG